jgi:hypothetical protein
MLSLKTNVDWLPTRARTWDLRIDMASVVKGAGEVLPFEAS